MKRNATVRVRAAEGSQGGRPSRASLDEAARLLAEQGFSIGRIGRFGISLHGEESLFLDVLGVAPFRHETPVQAVKASSAELAELVDLVESPAEPTVFSADDR